MTRLLKTQGRKIGRKPKSGQLKGEPDHTRLTETAATPLDSEFCWHYLLEEFLVVSEPLSCALKAEIPRREHVWSWLLRDGKGMRASY